MNYRVGQIIYLLNDKTLKVIPAQVCEEVVRNTLKGKEVTYIIKMPDKKRTTVSISDITTQIFTDSEELKNYMIDNAKTMISKLLHDAHTLEKIFTPKLTDTIQIPVESELERPTSDKNTTEEDTSVQNSKKDDTMVSVDMGNGMKARIRVEDLTHLNL